MDSASAGRPAQLDAAEIEDRMTLESFLMDLFRQMQLEPKVAIYQIPGKEGIALQIVKEGTRETLAFNVVGNTATLLELGSDCERSTGSVFQSPEFGGAKGTYQLDGVIQLPSKPNPWKKYKGMYKDNPLFDDVLTILDEERKERMANSHDDK